MLALLNATGAAVTSAQKTWAPLQFVGEDSVAAVGCAFSHKRIR
jgi:hypothetical protein